MASYLRPRRGRRGPAEDQNFVLKRGEVFFEAPDSGVGTGTGRIKIGDGTTHYKTLPYFFDHDEFITVVGLSDTEISFTETSITDNTTLLSTIISGTKLKKIIAAIKNLLANLNKSIEDINHEFIAPLPLDQWQSNTDPSTSEDYPYIFHVSTQLFNGDTLPPNWDLTGAGVIPTATERETIDMVVEAIFTTSGITLYANDQPGSSLTLRVKGV